IAAHLHQVLERRDDVGLVVGDQHFPGHCGPHRALVARLYCNAAGVTESAGMAQRILIAEDEESIIASLEFLMRRAGFETLVARDGDTALTLLADFRPHLVLLDIMLPARTGFRGCPA